MSLDSLRNLYQEIVLDYAKNPRNYGIISNYTNDAVVHNPTCGDTIKVFVKLKQDKIVAISFVGSGCTISKASASMMTQAVKGKSKAAALELVKLFSDLAIGKKHAKQEIEQLGDAQVLTNVMQFPARIKCATISWWGLEQALLKKEEEND